MMKKEISSSITDPNNHLDIKKLGVGDKVPNIEFSLINFHAKKAKFSDFFDKGKFIILDYWATWCTSCLVSFSKMDTLQKRYNEKLQVLLVNTKKTHDDFKKINVFFENKAKLKGISYQFPSIINDTITDEFFPHRLIPHYVWIDNTGTIQAITSSDEVTEGNIISFINGNNLNLKSKEDLDINKPLFIGGEGNISFKYRSSLTGYFNGLPNSAGYSTESNNMISRAYCTNASILALYKFAYPEISKFPKNRIILKVKDPNKYSTDGNWDTWKHENTYNYELIIPPTPLEQVRKYIQDDLKRFFGLIVYSQKQKAKCYIIKYKQTTGKLNSQNNISETNIFEKDHLPKYLHNYPIRILVEHLNTILSAPILDETNFLANINIDGLPNNLADIISVKQVLNKYGFRVFEEIRELEFIVLSEKHE